MRRLPLHPDPLAQVQRGLVKQVTVARRVALNKVPVEAADPDEAEVLSHPERVVVQRRLREATRDEARVVRVQQRVEQDLLHSDVEVGLQAVHFFADRLSTAGAAVEQGPCHVCNGNFE